MALNQKQPDPRICYFLQLPRELRDSIYAYALSEPQNLYFRLDGDIGRLYLKNLVTVVSKKSHGIHKRARVSREANQLRYTNRQLHQETSGLGINFNDIVFETLADAFMFFDNCPRSYLQGRRAFHILTTPLVDDLFPRSKLPPIAYNILKFCEEHPNITIWSPTDLLGQHNHSFITNAIYWQGRNRKPEDFVLLKAFATDPNKYNTMARWEAIRPIGLNVPINFRPTPPCGRFDESVVLMNGFRRWPYTEGDAERWRVLIKDIYANGI